MSIENNESTKSDKPKLSFYTSEWTEVYSQPEDTCGRDNHTEQEITFRAVDAMCNEHYIVIETDRWAIDIDEIDDFCKMLKDFITMKNFETEKVK